jgi:hypothetical protein
MILLRTPFARAWLEPQQDEWLPDFCKIPSPRGFGVSLPPDFKCLNVMGRQVWRKDGHNFLLTISVTVSICRTDCMKLPMNNGWQRAG